MKKNLVIGSGRGYSWYAFEPFVRSFKKNVPNADLVLFVDEISDFTRNYLKSIGGGQIKLEPFNKEFKDESPINARWKMFLRYVENHENEYDQILTSDTRDVIFQDDVFKYFSDKSNYLGYTTEAKNIGEDGINTSWITNCFGKTESEKLINKKIICCGTIIGTVKEIEIFLNKFIEYNPNLHQGGDDQATENYLIHNKLLPIENLVEIDCYSGAILTAQLFHELNPIRLKENLILRGDGGVPAIVHQYDRQPSLVQLVNKVYREKDFQPNYKLKDTKSVFEQIPHLVLSGNFETALKFLVNDILGKMDFGGQSELLIDTWGFALENNTPNNVFKEMVEIALQRAIIDAFSKKFLLLHLNRLLPHFIFAINNNRTLSSEFKIFIANGLFNFANMFFSNGNFAASKSYLDIISRLNIPLGQNFHMFRSQVYSRLGATQNI